MHILLGLLGLISAGFVWWYRLKMMRDAARGAGEAARAVKNLPRRMRFKKRFNTKSLDLIEDPREAAAIIMVEIAMSNGTVSDAERATMIAEVMLHFDMDESDAESLIGHAEWIDRNGKLSTRVIDQMAKVIMTAEGMTPDAILELDGMIASVMGVDAGGAGLQDGLIGVFRRAVGIS